MIEIYNQGLRWTKEEDTLRGFQWNRKNLGVVHIFIDNAGLATSGSLLDGKTKLDLNVK